MHSTAVLRAALAAVLVVASAVRAQDPARGAAAARHHDLVRVTTTDSTGMRRLLALDLDLAGCQAPFHGARQVDVIADAAALSALRRAGLPFTVEIEDLQDHHARQLGAHGPFPDDPTPPLGQGEMGGHYSLAQVLAILDQLAAEFPALCSARTSIGRSAEGRDIWLVKISDNVGMDESEPEVLYDALHHAREPISMATTLHFMRDLLDSYGTDPEATFIVDNRELYFVPVVNPDGYEHNRRTNPNGGGMWRKNRRVLGTGAIGVDLNRNYEAGFGGAGASSNPFADVYHGPFALSEPETRALDTLARSREFVQVCSSHSYTDILLRPSGYRSVAPDNVRDYDRIGAIATAANGIAHGSAGGLLYPAGGTALDHHHEIHGSLAWTPELGRSSEGGFWPTSPDIVGIAERHRPMFRALALLAGPELRDGELILMSSGTLGTTARVGLLGSAGGLSVLLAGRASASVAIPGIAGDLLLDPASTVALPTRQFGRSGYLTVDFGIPNDPRLTGLTVDWQAFHGLAGAAVLGNRARLQLR